jgi:hypothetical protein
LITMAPTCAQARVMPTEMDFQSGKSGRSKTNSGNKAD